MARLRSAFAIRINSMDPAKATIADDLASFGGVVSAERDLVYCFPSEDSRDHALRMVRGWAGMRSADSLEWDLVAPEPVASRTTQHGEGALAPPRRVRDPARPDREDGEAGPARAVPVSMGPHWLAPKFR